MLSLTATEFLERTSECVLVVGSDWTVKFCNDLARRELRSPDLEGSHLWSTFPAARGSVFEERYRLALERQMSQTFQAYYPSLERWYDVHAVPAGGNLAVFFRNLNGARVAPGEVRPPAPMLDALFDQTFLGVMQLDAAGRPIDANHQLCSLVARSACDLLSRPMADWIMPTDLKALEAWLRHVQATTAPGECEVRIMRPDGEIRHCSLRLSSEGSMPAGRRTILVFADITDRRQAEAHLREREQRLHLAARATNDVIWDHDLRSGEVSWNHAIEQLHGAPATDHVSWWVAQIHPEDRPRVTADIDTFIVSGGEHWQHEYRFARADGSHAHVLHRAFLVRDDGGAAVRMVGAMTDISQRVEAQQRLNRLQGELIHVSRVSAMGTMASALAHELNQPLTGIANYVSGARRLLEARGADALEDVLPALSLAADEVNNVGEMIRRLRRMVAHGRADVQPVALGRLVHDALSLAIPNPALAQVEIAVDLAPGKVDADPVQLQQVLVNLIRNATEAMEHAPTRRLRIWSTVEGDRHRVRVSDTGGGLSDEVAAGLFSAFRSTKENGMGVGLTICRTIIESHRGTIGVEETSPAGTTMFFVLPLSRADP